MKLRVPNKLSEISLEQAQRVLLIDQSDNMDEFAKKVHSVAIMTGRQPQQIAGVMYADLEAVYNQIFDMINGVVDAPLIPKVRYLRRDYAFIEDVRDMETGAFVDIDEMSKEENYANSLHKIMAVLYRPVDAKLGKRYRLKSYVRETAAERKERQAIFLKYMTLDVVRGATGFFLRVTERCLGISEGSYPRPQELKVEELMRGAGITLSMLLPGVNSSTMTQPSVKE